MPNEPYFLGVPIGKLIDKPIYAKGTMYAYRITKDLQKSTPSKVVYDLNKTKTYKNNDFIGNLDSWLTTTNTGVYLSFKDNAGTFYVPISNSFTSPNLSDIKRAIEKKEDEAANAGKSLLEVTINKYLPWIVGAVGVAIVLPSVSNTVQSSKISGTNDKTKVAIGAGLLMLLLSKKQSKNKVIIEPYTDTTNWQNTEAQTSTYDDLDSTRYLTYENPNLAYQQYEVMNGINKTKSKKKSTPTTC